MVRARSSTGALSDVGYIPFLSAHPHPAFVLLLSAHTTHGGPPLIPIFANSACRSLLLGPDAGTAELESSFRDALRSVDQSRRFTDWAFMSAHASGVPVTQTLTLNLFLRWLPNAHPPVTLEFSQTLLDDVIICTSVPRSGDLPQSAVPTPRSSLTHPLYSPNPSSLPSPGASCADMFASFDWASTPLGPTDQWPEALHACVSYTLSNPFPTCTWWGPELVLVYNDAYAEIAGSKHPSIFGKAGSIAWSELWEMIGPVSIRVMAGETVHRKDDLLFFNRLTKANLPEETYHNWNYVPVRGRDGKVNGYINGTFDNTQKVITERRLALIRELSTTAGLARTQAEFADALVNVLTAFPLEAPFAAIYYATVLEDASNQPHISRPYPLQRSRTQTEPPMKVQLSLRGTVGIPDGHPSMPASHTLLLDPRTLKPSPPSPAPAPSPASPIITADLPPLDDSNPGTSFRDRTTKTKASSSVSSRTSSSAASASRAGAPSFWPFGETFGARGAVHVPDLPSYVLAGFELRCWKEHAREAVVVALTSADADVPSVLLVLGLNSRRPYDDDYRAFIDLLRVSLGALLTAVQGREADVTRATQLAQLDEAKTTFFSNASHEFRTPLTLIQGPLQDCLTMVTDGKVKDRLQMATRNVTRLKRLVDSLLDFSKIAANKLEGRFRPVQLGPYTADLASLFRSVIEKSRIEYIVDCEKTDRTVCYVDPDFWEKIVFNLIGNAFKYTMEGSITVSMDISDGHMHFSVKDTGVGIPPSDIDKVFDRFHRVNSASRSYEGTGIGLALTKELVILHGGRLSLTSLTADDAPHNHGSKFTVSLPLGKEHLPTAHIDTVPLEGLSNGPYGKGIIDEAGHWSVRMPSTLEAPSDFSESDSGSSSESSRLDTSTLFFVKSDRILLVDDNADMRHYIRSLFHPFCQVIEAVNGQDALDKIDRVRPNLVISDVMMPVLDGFGLISRLRQRPDTRMLPIIIVTAKESEEARVEGLLSGADDYLCKPFTAKELIARVHLQMQLGKRRVQLEALFRVRTQEIQLLSDMSPVGIIRADVDGHVTYVNQRWREISGVTEDASMDSWCVALVDPEDLEAATSAWKDVVDSQRSASLEFRFSNGCYAKGQFEPLVSEAGTFIGTITDVSDQRKFEQARLAHAQERELVARKQAEEAEQRRKEADERRRGQAELLIDVTSHELRQPVSAILNCSSLVRSNLCTLLDALNGSAEQGIPFQPPPAMLKLITDDLDALDAIYQCGLAQERIANDVLSLSRIQLEVLSINPVDFDLVAEMKRIVSIFHNEVKMRHINLDVQIGDSIRELGIANVRSDKARFGQIVTNLLSNGIKFTDTSSGKRDILVTINASRTAPPSTAPCLPPLGPESPLLELPATVYLYCSVRDSGPGLRPDDLALLFRRFQQGSVSTINSHNVFGGSGLGLFVSRKLCDLMEGRIDVDSVYGEGATFRFFIKATATPGDLISPTSAPASPPALPIRKSGLQYVCFPRARILIAEDNIINQTILNRQLKGEGCITSLANNGLQALEHVRTMASTGGSQKTFDAILMDCEMPVMDGLTAVREIRRMESAGELPGRNVIFALTGNARSGQVENAREAGMDDVVASPPPSLDCRPSLTLSRTDKAL
ncbi:hypothetical protein K488DRAFT_44039 [Vararia minispora EC-137]|uniref:Uncharacterized protein n=1 Tax=Vararia minispora EC-137 TaxID=1314806 RepID=A0ACB8QTA2_9AGAM|nr:hypothetical protein K488DRAFT_44039 [Vararia minispora EC-137]